MFGREIALQCRDAAVGTLARAATRRRDFRSWDAYDCRHFIGPEWAQSCRREGLRVARALAGPRGQAGHLVEATACHKGTRQLHNRHFASVADHTIESSVISQEFCTLECGERPADGDVTAKTFHTQQMHEGQHERRDHGI